MQAFDKSTRALQADVIYENPQFTFKNSMTLSQDSINTHQQHTCNTMQSMAEIKLQRQKTVMNTVRMTSTPGG